MKKVRVSDVAYINKNYFYFKGVSEIHYLDTGNITKNRINGYKKLSVSDEIPSRARRAVNTGTIVYSSVRPRLSHYGILSDIPDNTVVSTGFITLDAKSIIDPHYLYYAITTPDLIEYMSKIADTSVSSYPSINSNDLGNMEIEIVEDYDEQCRIANILKCIDKLIDNNTRISSELDALAKLIYDYWFLQFEFPNEEGKPYKSSGGKMVWNEELGREIPEGWSVERLGNVVDVILGGTPDTNISRYWENGSINWLSSGEMANFPIVRADKKITSSAVQESATKLMPKGTVALSITRYIRPTILGIDSCANQSVVGILESETYKYPYVYPYIVNMVNAFLTLRTGAQQPHINKKTVNNSAILCPPNDVLDLYYQIVTPIYEQILSFANENLELASLRDWLLPLLMNGQVGFHEAEDGQ